MDTTRRDFLGRMATTTAMLGVMPLSLDDSPRHFAGPLPASADWDLSWVSRITGKHKGIFDVPEIESGYGVWRASIWGAQYQDVLKVPAKDMTAVLVLRHNGIALAMQQQYWDSYGVGKEKSVTHPVTQQPTEKNPALLTSAGGDVPERFDAFALPKFIARGGIALACNLAFEDCVATIRSKEGVSAEEARKRALALLVPGVIMQPSGVFAAMRAQEAGCIYLRAS